MKIKKQVYPKTTRLSYTAPKAQITEKLDGSNLAIGVSEGKLYICMRNNIIESSEIGEHKNMLYKGLYAWVNEHEEFLKEEIHEGSVMCGEWLGMGKLKYPKEMTDKRFFMFAKARFTEDLGLTKIRRERDLLNFCFESHDIPEFIDVVPCVQILNFFPSVEDCNVIYTEYSECVDRNVEGFVINYLGSIHKYVRMKNGKIEPHKEGVKND